MKIWILQGSCGEYSDRTDWIVKAYTTFEAADADQLKATVQAGVYNKASRGYADGEGVGESFQCPFTDEGIAAEIEARQRILTLDPKANFACLGDMTYWVEETELVGI